MEGESEFVPCQFPSPSASPRPSAPSRHLEADRCVSCGIHRDKHCRIEASPSPELVPCSFGTGRETKSLPD